MQERKESAEFSQDPDQLEKLGGYKYRDTVLFTNVADFILKNEVMEGGEGLFMLPHTKSLKYQKKENLVTFTEESKGKNMKVQ